MFGYGNVKISSYLSKLLIFHKEWDSVTQQTMICFKSPIETLENVVKYVQS